MEAVTFSLILVIALAIVFDYINGFHDTANAIATSVATRALSPRVAVLMAASFNFIGAFAGTAVAKTIGAGLVDETTTTQTVVMAALLGAITWNLITWYFGIPSSSSHALIGGLLGATIIAAGVGALDINGIVNKVLIPMVTSPLIGFVVAFGLMLLLYWTFRNAQRKPMARIFRRLQVMSAGFMAFSHGSNDAQKTMGIITLALFSAGVIESIEVPTWVIIVSATALSLGTAVGGWRIMHTMGHRVVKLEPVHGFAAETTAASVLLGTAALGMPVSTTHVISSAIMGVGSRARSKGGALGCRPSHPARLGHHHPDHCVHRGGRLVRPAFHRLRLSKETRMSFRLLPKDVRFFDLFTADGENLQAAAHALYEMVKEYDRLDERIVEIQRLEKEGDEIDRQIGIRLEDAFVTPFDREDIHELTVRLDDVVDGIQATAETFVIYGIERPTEEAVELARILAGQSVELLAALRKLDGLKGLETAPRDGPRA